MITFLYYKGARIDLKNNEKKLALDMATNAACASLLKKKQSAGMSSSVVLIRFSLSKGKLNSYIKYQYADRH